MLDDILDYIENIRERPVWQPIPDDVRARFRAAVPTGPSDLAAVHDEFMRHILPYATGNAHPGFMGWVHGGGNVPGMLAEMLAAGLNANLGGRDHMPIEVERQITHWLRKLFEFPDTASGLFVTGTSMANLLGVLIARTRELGTDVRRDGVAAAGKRLVAYTSAAAHGCISQAMDLSGLGTAALHVIPTNEHHQIDIDALKAAIAQDRNAGLTPFLLVGTAGSVDTGAIDDLAALAAIANQEETLVSRRRRHRRARHPGAGHRAAARRHPAGGFDRARFPQMGAGALRRRLHPGARRHAASRYFCVAGGLFAARDARPRGRHAVALRFRSRSLARLSRAEDLVHAEGLRHRGAGRDDIAHLPAGALSRDQDRHRARTGTARPGFAQHRLLPLSRRRCRSPEREDRRGFARIRHRGAVHDHHRQPPRDPRGHRQSPHRAARYRRDAEGGLANLARLRRQIVRLKRGKAREFRQHESIRCKPASGHADRIAGALQDGVRRARSRAGVERSRSSGASAAGRRRCAARSFDHRPAAGPAAGSP